MLHLFVSGPQLHDRRALGYRVGDVARLLLRIRRTGSLQRQPGHQRAGEAAATDLPLVITSLLLWRARANTSRRLSSRPQDAIVRNADWVGCRRPGRSFVASRFQDDGGRQVPKRFILMTPAPKPAPAPVAEAQKAGSARRRGANAAKRRPKCPTDRCAIAQTTARFCADTRRDRLISHGAVALWRGPEPMSRPP